MNILFLTIARMHNLKERGIYTDLFRKFVEKGHGVYIASPAERMMREKTNLKKYDGYSVLRVKVGNFQKTNMIEKGISTLFIETHFLAAIKKYYSDIKFDAVVYATPPMTYPNVVDFIKKRDGAKIYLLLKDIFPQNAVDIGLFTEKSLIYKYFRKKEIRVYKQSDSIGCMSQANVDFLLEHNDFIDKSIVHICPNCIEYTKPEKVDKAEIRKKYNIPAEATVFIYGGNLGKPQCIPFIIDLIKANYGKKDRFFVISGTGTEAHKLRSFYENEKPENLLLTDWLQQDEYDRLIAACDVGMLFLDHRFTIPNIPSRILTYMRHALPVFAATDVNTDMGKIISDGDFGWWCESKNAEKATEYLDKICEQDLTEKGKNSLKFLLENYTTDIGYECIMENLKSTINDLEK